MSEYRSECSECGQYGYLNDDAVCADCRDGVAHTEWPED